MMKTVQYDVEKLKVGDEIHSLWINHKYYDGRYETSDFTTVDEDVLAQLKSGKLPEIDEDYRSRNWRLISVTIREGTTGSKWRPAS